MEADGIRPTDYAYRDAVDAVFKQIYREGRYGVISGERHPLVVELVGSREDRLDQLARAAAEVSDRDQRGRG
jgi:mannose/fructose-specific phosphotransferase system component IIA